MYYLSFGAGGACCTSPWYRLLISYSILYTISLSLLSVFLLYFLLILLIIGCWVALAGDYKYLRFVFLFLSLCCCGCWKRNWFLLTMGPPPICNLKWTSFNGQCILFTNVVKLLQTFFVFVFKNDVWVRPLKPTNYFAYDFKWSLKSIIIKDVHYIF